MHAADLKAMYRRWLLEVWGAGRYQVVDERLHVDLVDRNRYEGRAGDVGAAQMVRRQWACRRGKAGPNIAVFGASAFVAPARPGRAPPPAPRSPAP